MCHNSGQDNISTHGKFQAKLYFSDPDIKPSSVLFFSFLKYILRSRGAAAVLGP